MKSIIARLIALAVVGLMVVTPARADMIGFSYSWTVMPSSVLPSGTGSVLLAPAMPDTGSALLDGPATFIPGAEIRTTSSAVSPPDSFNTPFHMKLSLTDTASGQSWDFTFSGQISGNLTHESSSLTSTFDNPVSQSKELGGNMYSVTIAPTLAALPSPVDSVPALIDARIQIASITGGEPQPEPTPVPEPKDVPEPCSLLLGATALAGFVVRRYWTRKQVD